MKKKKTDKSKIHATQLDVERAKKQAYKDAIRYAMAIFLTVLVDKFNGEDHIQDVWREVEKLSEEITEKRVSIPDLVRVLKNEYGIEI